ncbi:MAG: hypothetical protein NVS1B9_01910 [Solirubrobacteraceae bacterium]
MPYMNCPRCSLSVRVRADYLKLERCPRCLARTGESLPLYQTDTPREQPPSGNGSLRAEPALDDDGGAPASSLKVDGGGNAERQVLALRGEFDIAGALEFARSVRVALAPRPKSLVLDLQGLEFIDSSGLRAILNTAHLCERRGCELSLIPGPPAVERAFTTAGLSDALRWQRGSRVEALQDG